MLQQRTAAIEKLFLLLLNGFRYLHCLCLASFFACRFSAIPTLLIYIGSEQQPYSATILLLTRRL